MTQASAERVYQETKEQILSGQLTGGTLLSEGQVAQSLGVSRTPAREAFVRLQAEGLLSLLPRRGAVVAAMSVAEAVDVLEARLALEGAALTRLAHREDRWERLSEARTRLEEQSEYVAAGSLADFIASDARFHLAVVGASGNALIEGMYASLGDRQRLMARAALSSRPDRVVELLSEHHELLRLAVLGDAAEYTLQLQRHLDTTYDLLTGR